MKPRTMIAAAAAFSTAALLSGCYSSRTTEVVPAPSTAAAPVASCYYSNVPYSTGSRVVTPEARTIECGRDGFWHTVQSPRFRPRPGSIRD